LSIFPFSLPFSNFVLFHLSAGALQKSANPNSTQRNLVGQNISQTRAATRLPPFQAIPVRPKQYQALLFQTIPVRPKPTSYIPSISSQAKTIPSSFIPSHSSQAETDFLNSKLFQSGQNRLLLFQAI
jgi:hypothetical protein